MSASAPRMNRKEKYPFRNNDSVAVPLLNQYSQSEAMQRLLHCSLVPTNVPRECG